MKIQYLSSKGTKLNQIIILITVFLIFAIIFIPLIANYNTLSIKQIIQFILLFILWIFNIYLLTKYSEAKLIDNKKIIYKKIFSGEKVFSIDKIIKLKIILKDFIYIKYSQNGKEDVLWIRNKENLIKAFDIYKIIKDTKKEYEKDKGNLVNSPRSA